MESGNPIVTAIILNTNRRDDTLECLQSTASSSYQPLKIMVLDNASTDGSIEAIQSQFPDVQLVSLNKNKGYTGNNNVGIQIALDQKSDWLLILNEDTTMSADCIARMVEAGESDPRVGVVGPMVYHHDEPGIIQSAGGFMDKAWNSHHLGENEIDQGQYATRRTVDWISGCAIMFRRSVLEQLGGYDEGFFYYNEEVDLCYRARQAGWKVMIASDAKLWHKGVQRHYHPNPSVTYYGVRNQLLFMKRHSASLGVRLTNWAFFLRRVTSWTLRPKWRQMRPHRDAAVQAMLDYLGGREGKRT